MKFDIFKLIFSIVWLAVIVNFFYSFPEWLALALNVIGVLLVLTHLTEFFVFRKVIAQQPESFLLKFIMTFLYGVLYWKNLSK